MPNGRKTPARKKAIKANDLNKVTSVLPFEVFYKITDNVVCLLMVEMKKGMECKTFEELLVCGGSDNDIFFLNDSDSRRM